MKLKSNGYNEPENIRVIMNVRKTEIFSLSIHGFFKYQMYDDDLIEFDDFGSIKIIGVDMI